MFTIKFWHNSFYGAQMVNKPTLWLGYPRLGLLLSSLVVHILSIAHIAPAKYMRLALTHLLYRYYRNESFGTATITNDKALSDNSYDLLANDLNKSGTKHANDWAHQII